MFNLGSWNVWGLNSFHKQKIVQEWTSKNNLDLFGLFETKITASNLDTLAPHLAIPPWQYTTNITSSTSCRIFVGWNRHKLSLTHLTSSSQWLTCEITTPSSLSTIRLTFVYGHNTPAERRTLWTYLSQESSQNTCTPWIVIGDFNAIMHAGDRTGGDTN
jgi:exonuclease III